MVGRIRAHSAGLFYPLKMLNGETYVHLPLPRPTCSGCPGDKMIFLSQITSPEAHTRASAAIRAHNSAVECHLHTVEVVGSNPAVPTNPFNNLGAVTVEAFAAFCGKSSEV